MYVEVFTQKYYDICNLLGKGSTKNIYDKANTAKYLLSLHGEKIGKYSFILFFPLLCI